MPLHIQARALTHPSARRPCEIALRGRQTEQERTRKTVRGDEKTRERETNTDRKNERDSERGSKNEREGYSGRV